MIQVSERVFRLLDQDLSGVGQDLPACLGPLQSRLQQTAGDILPLLTLMYIVCSHPSARTPVSLRAMHAIGMPQ